MWLPIWKPTEKWLYHVELCYLSVWVRMDICTWNTQLVAVTSPYLRFPSRFTFSSFGCRATVHLHVRSPDLALFFLWVFSARCESLLLLQLISVTVLNFSQLLNVLAIQVPTLGSLFFLSPAAPLPHSEFCSAFVLVWIIPCGLLPSSLYYPDIIKGNIWSARKSPSALSLLQKKDCQKEQLQEVTIGPYIRGEKVACVTPLENWAARLNTSYVSRCGVYLYVSIYKISINNIWMALCADISDIQWILCQTASSKSNFKA